MQDNIIGAPLTSKQTQRLYDFLSPFYDYLTQYERPSKEKGLEMIDIRRGDSILEVGFGTGQILMKLAVRVGKSGRVHGLDLSPKMLEKTRTRITKNQLTRRVALLLGDARNLPYNEDVFDVLFTSYMLDLIDTPDLIKVLAEFKRVLKPGGRLVVVNLSKGGSWYSNMKLYEWVYKKWPSLLGGCRPVTIRSFLEELGFLSIKREIVLAGRIIPTEIVRADKAT